MYEINTNQAVQEDVAEVMGDITNLTQIVNTMDDQTRLQLDPLLKKPGDTAPDLRYVDDLDDEYDSEIVENVAAEIIGIVKQSKQIPLGFYIAVLNQQISHGRRSTNTQEIAGDLELINDELKIEGLVADYIAEMHYNDEEVDEDELYELVANDVTDIDSRVRSIDLAMEMLHGETDCDFLIPLYFAWKIGQISDDNCDRILDRTGYKKDFDAISEKIDAEKQDRLEKQGYGCSEEGNPDMDEIYRGLPEGPDGTIGIDRIGLGDLGDELAAGQTTDEVTGPRIDKQRKHWGVDPSKINQTEIHTRMYRKDKLRRRR